MDVETMSQCLTLTFPYYQQPKMFAWQMWWLSQLPERMKDNLELIVVDDGSPVESLEIPVPTGIASRFFRIDVDVPWNLACARNIASKHAKHDWILFTDIDHLAPLKTMDALLSNDYLSDTAYTFQRQNLKRMQRHAHKNSYFVHKSLLDKMGGEDERTAGLYAEQEYDFGRRAQMFGLTCELPLPLTVVFCDYCPDSKVTSLPRKSDENGRRRLKMREEREKIPNWKPLALSYAYHELNR